jgi:hypothetical protein
METFREDFDNRSGEILAYLDLLNFIEGAGSEICATENDSRFVITSEARKTLKGTVYILLYNLIESSLREAICFIHDTIYNNNTAFDDLRDSLKKEIIKRLKNDAVSAENFLSGLAKGISCGASMATFNKQKLFSGNIDKLEVKDKSNIYGFSTSTDYVHTKHGENLSVVKRNRNDLAHGNFSFSEIGKNVTYQDLENVSLEVIAYLDKITENIESYVNADGYLA